MKNTIQTSNSGFSGLGIAPNVMRILVKLNYTTPTAIQRQAIPVALQGKDLVGVAQTGTGKTLAFGIPLLQRLQQVNGVGLIIVPTRELALQVDEVLRMLGTGAGLRTAVLIGGAPIRPQIRDLNRAPHVIVATPGRMNDHLQQKTVSLKNVRVAVLDEADRMMDLGFAPQIKKIFQELPSQRQTMLFSATLGPEIMKMATGFMKLPIRIEVAPTGSVAEHLTQEIFIIPKEDKTRLVENLLGRYLGATLIFTKTKHGAKKLAKDIRDMGHSAAEIHSGRSLPQRKDAMAGFKSGKYRVLVATDIASRGIDVTGIELVINYDLPTNTEEYVHRIGRTARAGGAGHAISFVAPEQRRELHEIERLIRKPLLKSPVPDLPPKRQQKFTSMTQQSRKPFLQHQQTARRDTGFPRRRRVFHEQKGSHRRSR